MLTDLLTRSSESSRDRPVRAWDRETPKLLRPSGATARREGPGEVEGLVPCRESFRALAHEEWLTEDGPHPAVELGAVAARSGHRRSRRPCHSHAISSGHERYPADSHGHSEKAPDRA